MKRPADIFVDIQAHIEAGRFIRDTSTNRLDIRDFTFSDVDLGDCKDILDLGCAYGFFTRGLAGRLHPEARVIGVDLWQGCGEHFIKTCRESGFAGQFQLSDKVFCQRYADESFDLVLCSYTLYFFPEALAEIARVLRPNGHFIAVTHAVPHMPELVDNIRMLLERHLGRPIARLPLEDIFDTFSSVNGLRLLSPRFPEIREKTYTNSLRIDEASLPRLLDYLCFKRPLFIPEDFGLDDRFIRSVVADYFREFLSSQGPLMITKDDMVYICQYPESAEAAGTLKKTKRKHCHYCGATVELKMEDATQREYCRTCKVYFYDNPLPVVSTILVKDRQVLLVKRGNEPFKGEWCLPSGFAESGESIAEAALRELEEETGVKGKVVQLQDVDSCSNYFYGDLLFLTFEVEQVDGKPTAGDDAVEVRYFPIDKVPPLAFPSNSKALRTYVEGKKELWAIIDSFSFAADDETLIKHKENLLSNLLVELIEDNSDRIAGLWLEDVTSNKSTPTYHVFDQQLLYHRVFLVISHFGQWLSGAYRGQDIVTYYVNLGRERKLEGFGLSEVISALSLTKKYIWEFALSQGMWKKTIDIYKIMELERRISLFFDKATYHVAKGYEGTRPPR